MSHIDKDEQILISNKIGSLITYSISKSIIKTIGGCYLDGNNICWKMIDGRFIGKRSVWTLDYRACWLEDTTIENVKSWWCGGAEKDYTEIFINEP